MSAAHPTDAVHSIRPDGPDFDAAMTRLRDLGAARRLPVERLPLARAHGRVLAEDLPAAVLGSEVGPEAGAPLLANGCVLTPARIALAAQHGLDRLVVSRRPTVAVFTCGDALVEPGLPLQLGQAYDSQRESLMGLLRAEGLEPVAWPCLPEDPQTVTAGLRHAGHAFDVVLVCGGMSADGLGPVSALMRAEGLVHVPAVRMWPAMSLLCAESRPDAPSDVLEASVLEAGEYPSGSRKSLGEALFLCLPYDPRSVHIAVVTLCRALFDALQGRREPRPRLRVRLRRGWHKSGDGVELLPATLESDENGLLWAAVEDYASTPAAALRYGVGLDALVVLEDGGALFEPGRLVDALLL